MSFRHSKPLLAVSSLMLIVVVFGLCRRLEAQQVPRTLLAGRTQAAPAAVEPHETPLEFTYPDPKTVGVVARPVQSPRKTHAHAPGPATPDRYAGIPEAEVARRACEDRTCGHCRECVSGELCPLCENNPQTPCGQCKMCQAGFPCEKTLCRHCIQQRSMNMGNSCDLSAGDEPCGTCDACREHRSDPCEHADNGYGPRGEFNPYKERRFMSVIPRPILDTYNNGARKFPVYYNPAPYYRPHWNPSLYAGYNRPFSFRWSCPLCFKNPCECNRPGYAGQVPYAYTCKFCNRNPCACTAEICDVTKPLDPAGISKSLADMRRESTQPQHTETREAERSEGLLDDKTPETLEN